MRRTCTFLVSLGCSTVSATDCAPVDPVFKEIGIAAGMDFQHEGPISYPEMLFMSAGGVAGDFNGDGWQDVFVLASGARPDALYINNQDGTFTDQAAAAGLDRVHYGVGASAADFDNDGDLDIYVTSHSADGQSGSLVAAPGHHRLYRNNGDGTFTDVAQAAGVNTTALQEADGWSSSWGDYDLDGDLDLAVAGWFLNRPGRNRLFENLGNGTFADVTQVAGLASLEETFGFSPRFADMDGDRYPELIWTADFETSRYFVNNTDGTFTDATQAAGVSLETNGMGVTIADFNRDGRLDWYATSIDKSQNEPDRPEGHGNMLYLNQGAHTYLERSRETGVSEGWWGWGADAVDFNHDTQLDIVETNGWYYSPWVDQPSCLWLGRPDGTFSEAASATGFIHNLGGRGLITLDIDNDMDRDIIVFTRSDRPYLYRNDTPQTECTNAITIVLETQLAPTAAPHGVGARIRVSAGGIQQTAEVHAGTNFISQSELSAHFGLGDSQMIDEVLVTWPDGTISTRTDVSANARLTIHAPSPCPADQNSDGTINGLDFGAWLGNFNNQDPRADVNNDGTINGLDFGAWLGAFNAGCD